MAQWVLCNDLLWAFSTRCSPDSLSDKPNHQKGDDLFPGGTDLLHAGRSF
ncbi:MAG: hypothetical protein ACP5OP_07055 [Leptospirillia bacterium]